MPVRVVWGDNKIGLLFFTEMMLSVVLMIDVVLSFHTGACAGVMYSVPRVPVQPECTESWLGWWPC